MSILGGMHVPKENCSHQSKDCLLESLSNFAPLLTFSHMQIRIIFFCSAASYLLSQGACHREAEIEADGVTKKRADIALEAARRGAFWGFDCIAEDGLADKVFQHLGVPKTHWAVLKQLPEVGR